MHYEIYILDLIGTFAFAVYGSYFALREKYDLFGIFISAFLTAVGGGTIREIMLNNVPFYFYDNYYIITIILAIIFTIIVYKKFHKIKPFALILDSIGLVTFAFIGAFKAYNFGLGFFGVIFFAMITAVGGGILRDIILNKQAKIFKYDLYATLAILIGVLYYIFASYMHIVFYINLLLLFFLVIRILVIVHKINLYKPKN